MLTSNTPSPTWALASSGAYPASRPHTAFSSVDGKPLQRAKQSTSQAALTSHEKQFLMQRQFAKNKEDSYSHKFDGVLFPGHAESCQFHGDATA